MTVIDDDDMEEPIWIEKYVELERDPDDKWRWFVVPGPKELSRKAFNEQDDALADAEDVLNGMHNPFTCGCMG